MSTITIRDGTEIFYKDWGTGTPVVFSHGWPLSSDAFEDQMFFLAGHGYRCIAHDRRGHGRSSQPWNGNDLDTYADDLATLVEKLDLRKAIHVGHSTGGGEVARYIGRHGTSRVSKAVLIGAIPPLMLKTEINRGGLPSRSSINSVQLWLPTGRNFGRISACLSTVTTGRTLRYRKAYVSHLRFKGCQRGFRPPIFASKHFPRPTLLKISENSIYRLWSFTVTMTRSCRSPTRLCFRPS